MTDNDLYAGLSRRWNRRAKVLANAGFSYGGLADLLEGLDVRIDGPAAVWYRRRVGRLQVVPAAMLHHASNRAWNDLLGSVLRRGSSGV